VGSSTDLIAQHVEYVQQDQKRETVLDCVKMVEVRRGCRPGCAAARPMQSCVEVAAVEVRMHGRPAHLCCLAAGLRCHAPPSQHTHARTHARRA
jgi:hypothetical protein